MLVSGEVHVVRDLVSMFLIVTGKMKTSTVQARQGGVHELTLPGPHSQKGSGAPKLQPNHLLVQSFLAKSLNFFPNNGGSGKQHNVLHDFGCRCYEGSLRSLGRKPRIMGTTDSSYSA